MPLWRTSGPDLWPVSALFLWKPFVFTEFDFNRKPCGPTPGSADSIFAPDFTFGNLTISGARAIDLSWNLFVDRGLQFSVGWASYQVVTGVLLCITEKVPVSYEVFVALVFNTNSMAAVHKLVTAVRSTPGFRFKATFIALLLSAISFWSFLL